MIKRLCSPAAVALAGAALVAGCGSSSSSTTSTSTSSSSAASGGIESNPQVAAAVDACKQKIGAAPTLSAASKSKLQMLCADAANNPSAANIKKIGNEVCVQIVKDSVPAAVQQQALAACPKA